MPTKEYLICAGVPDMPYELGYPCGLAIIPIPGRGRPKLRCPECDGEYKRRYMTGAKRRERARTAAPAQ